MLVFFKKHVRLKPDEIPYAYFVVAEQLSAVERISRWCKCFSPGTLKEGEQLPELARPAWGWRMSGYVAPLNRA